MRSPTPARKKNNDARERATQEKEQRKRKGDAMERDAIRLSLRQEDDAIRIPLR